jgi:serine/threonine protein kinase
MEQTVRQKGRTISPERWQRLQVLFERALPLDQNERLSLLHAECRDDPSLREQAWALLLASTDTGGLEQQVDNAIASSMRSRELQSGQRVGRYRIVRLLGRGGMGCVYYAERADEQYQQSVALKVVEWGLALQDLTGRFRSERQILAHLTHSNIARLLDGGEMPDGTPFLVMEYVAGTRIDHYCRERGLDTRAKLNLMRQVCAAVQYAHQKLVVHRDLKPSNILVTEDGVPKLLDFGIAKLMNSDSSFTNQITQFFDRVLTPDHASPEQLLGRPVGTSSDIYASAAV